MPVPYDPNSNSNKIDNIKIKALKLTEVKKLNDSYLNLKYDVINDTEID